MGSRAFLVAAVVAVAVAAAGADVAADRAECSDKLVALATCLTFVQGQGQAPTPDCCGGLKTVLQTSPKCLCVLVKDRDDPGLDLKLNVTRALGLPAACSAPANISDCPIIHALCPRMWPRPEPVPDHWCGDCKKLKGSPLAARTMGGNLRRQPDVNHWRRVGDQDLFKVWMGPLWWSYYQLGEQARRCFAYCCIFPRRHHLYRDELVRLWIAEGFIRSTDEGVDIEDVGQEIFNQLLSVSFLQPGGNDIDWNNGCYKDYYLVHDLLHDLAEAVAGSDCFRIDNNMSQKGEGWTGDVPRDVRHLFVQSYDATLITEKILELGKLHTLIIYSVRTPVEKIVIKKILKSLPKLRVLAIASSLGDAFIREPYTFSVPESISQLKHLRYLSFRTYSGCMVTLPSSLNQLYLMQLLDFGSCMNLVFSCGDLINLRHVCSGLRLQFSNISRLVSLQTIPPFTVRYEQGHEAKQLRYLNRLSGKLHISGLQRIKSREEALEVHLAAKKRLTDLTLSFTGSSNVAAEVLEGLCPPVGLEKLTIFGYEGSAYPNWMVGRQNGGPEKLQKLSLYDWSQPGPAPELKAFIHLRSLYLRACSWNALPGNMEHLSSLESLTIIECLNVRSLPTLPQSLEFFTLEKCDARLMKSCQTDGHPNWQKIQHVDWKEIY